MSFVGIFAGAPGWILRVLAPLVALSAAEVILITLLLRQWQPDIPSLWHAWRRRERGIC